MSHRKKVLLKVIILGDSGCVRCLSDMPLPHAPNHRGGATTPHWHN